MGTKRVSRAGDKMGSSGCRLAEEFGWLVQQSETLDHGEVSIKVIVHGGLMVRVERGLVVRLQSSTGRATTQARSVPSMHDLLRSNHAQPEVAKRSCDP